MQDGLELIWNLWINWLENKAKMNHVEFIFFFSYHLSTKLAALFFILRVQVVVGLGYSLKIAHLFSSWIDILRGWEERQVPWNPHLLLFYCDFLGSSNWRANYQSFFLFYIIFFIQLLEKDSKIYSTFFFSWNYSKDSIQAWLIHM